MNEKEKFRALIQKRKDHNLAIGNPLFTVMAEEDDEILREIDSMQNDDIEYTRTDAFVEKACEWIREFNNHHYIMRYSDSCEPPLSELTEWFKNYMKGE